MPWLQTANNARTTLNANITAGASSLVLANNASRFPEGGGGEKFRLTIWSSVYNTPGDDPNQEIVECTSRSGSTVTIGTRGVEGTTGVAHSAGDNVAVAITDGLLDEMRDYITANAIQGETGETGTAATIAVGTITTGAAGSDAEVANSGSSSAAVFDFTIPRGDTGATGPQGPQGDPGAGSGDMLAATYDPQNIADDAFDVDNHTDGTTNKVYTATEESKLAGIEASADVTDATNVAAAGAVMEADTSTSSMSFVIDEDNMASDSATKVPTQQSVKAYADTKVTANAGITGATNTKITYDAKGLVTAGAAATTADIADSTDKRYVTDAESTVIDNTSGSNTGDQDLSGLVTKATYDAHTVLYATSDNTPVALTVGEQTVVGRTTGGNIAAIAIDSDLASVSASDDTVPSAKATKAALDAKAPLASPTFTGTVTLPTGLTGVLRADTGVVSTDSDVTDLVSAASDTAAGKVELATTAEAETGTSTTLAVTPDALHDMTTLSGAAWFLDEDGMDSNSAVKTASQQSIKAYVDGQVAGGGYTDEEAQDAVGTILTDTDTIDFTYTDATPTITADVKDDSITYAKMQNVVSDGVILGNIGGAGGIVDELTAAEVRTLINVEDGADVTDTANVTSAGALMDSEVDADIKTLSLPASTTITAFGASIVDDADEATFKATVNLEIGTDVQAYNATLAAVAGGTYSGDDSITTVGTISTGTWSATDVAVTAGGTGASTAAAAAVNLAVIPTSGWIDQTSVTWTRTGNFTFTISGDVTATYRKGTKVRYKDGGSFEYGVVASSSYSNPDTTITLISNDDYAMAATTITENWISFIESPEGFPHWFNWAAGTTITGFSANPTNLILQWHSLGGNKLVIDSYGTAGTSNATGYTYTLPVAAATVSNRRWYGACPVAVNNSAAVYTAQARIASAGTTLILQLNASDTGWTNSGTKIAFISNLIYQF